MTGVLGPFDAAVIIPTTLRPSLARAVRSVFAQDVTGRVQILVGVDVVDGPVALLAELGRECPEHMGLTVLYPGYSTARRHGGFYANWDGGGLRTVLSYLANSRYVGYFDDDNWWAPDHLSSLLAAIEGFDWAFSLRRYVDPATDEAMAVDEWESVGPGRGIHKESFNGFVGSNCFFLDKMRCHWAFPAWCIPHRANGSGVDRTLFEVPRARHSVAWTGRATVYYTVHDEDRGRVRSLIEGKIR